MTKQVAQRSTNLLWVMVGVLLIATAAYLFRLNEVSFWQDESWMAIAISDGFRHVWTFAAERGAHPPLYFYIAWFVQYLFGNGEFALRWMGGLISLVGVAMTFRLGSDLIDDRRAGTFAALLVAGSLLLVYVTRLARHYTLFYTLSATTIWVYWHLRRHPKNWRWWLMLVLMQTAALYTHYFSVFIAMTIGLHALLTLSPRHSLRVIGALILSAVLFLPWVPSILIQLHSDLGEGVDYGGRGLRVILENYSGRVTNANWWLGGVFTLAGIFRLLRDHKWTVGSLLLIWIVGTFIPVLVINETLFQWYIGRNMLYTLPAVVIVYGAGLAALSHTRTGMIVAVGAAAAYMLFGAYVFTAFWPGTPDWRGILHRIALDARPDDIFVLDSKDPYTPDYYLWRYLGQHVTFYDMKTWTANPVLGDRIWFIDTGMDINHEALAVVSDEMVRTRRFAWLPMVADFWQKPPAAPIVTFGQQLALGYSGIESISAQAGQQLEIDVWWMALRIPDVNYSSSFQVIGDTRAIAQQDGSYDSGRVDAQVLPVGVWTPDRRVLSIAEDAAPGLYTLFVTVYDWHDGTRLPTDSETPDNLYPLLTVVIEG